MTMGDLGLPRGSNTPLSSSQPAELIVGFWPLLRSCFVVWPVVFVSSHDWESDPNWFLWRLSEAMLCGNHLIMTLWLNLCVLWSRWLQNHLADILWLLRAANLSPQTAKGTLADCVTFCHLSEFQFPRPKMEWWFHHQQFISHGSGMVFVGHWSVAQPQVHHKHWETTEHAAGEGHVFSPESQGWSLSIDQMCRPWRIVFYRVTILAKHMEECTIQSWVNRFGGPNFPTSWSTVSTESTETRGSRWDQHGSTDESMTLQVFTAKNLRSQPSVGFSLGTFGRTMDHGAVLERARPETWELSGHMKYHSRKSRAELGW